VSARPEDKGSAPRQTIDVWVQGQRFEVRTDADRDTAHEVARYVNQKINDAASHCGPASRLNVAVLAVLNLAQEHLELMREHARLRQEVEEASRRLVGSIERVL